MQVIVNGHPSTVHENATVAELVRELGLENQPIAVEVNRSVVGRSRYAFTRLAPGDQVEVIHFVGGG